MLISTLHSLPLAEAYVAFPILSGVVAWWQENLSSNQAIALDVPEVDYPHDLGVDAEFILLVMPDDLAPCLPELAATTFFTYNRDSDDLLTRQTLLALQAKDTWVEVDAWCTDFHKSQGDKFYVGLVAADRFVLTLHDYSSGDDMLAFVCELQAACGQSGPNYNPWRYHSESELEAAARGEPQTFDESLWKEPLRRLVCRSVHPV